ncbi:NAD(P)-dependent dehydrogenase, short-chain alcohol dehydrogenase family [Aliiroseovarius halocynthiae]|uniref:SDR family oxidoreductase n=1 Tax=Aliiroseovarius halocynthiae TaxID=985055 RepID=A0A545SUE2_9RHOB|nr:SDR family oxidoreductase [Aliiroseovarius halocynthiae]TQV68590.1 SDR family oxidoreductase [Aliiroseovarius halocynthiae]SMR71000.1 NAD(P)-dependent dehydrogenase, short-chain alcohol dehydrogenase family [Aliiroseovarius halocynthiae]
MRIVITGASRGIGQELSQRYQAQGHEVIGTSRSGENGLVALDVTDPDALLTLKKTIGDAPIELLICNAGIYPDKYETMPDGYPAQMWQEGWATNVTGVFLTVQALLPNIQEARGKIAIISSQMASHTRAPGGSYIYRASKAAVLNLGRNLATDLSRDGISVGIYHPGWVQTDMGGDNAEIDVGTSVSGLMDRFTDLSLSNTGCFEAWDGKAMPY